MTHDRKPDCRNALTIEQKDQALAMRAEGKTWPWIAEHFGRIGVKMFSELIRRHEYRTTNRPKRPNGAPQRLRDWTPEEHAILVKMAPTGCGAAAIAEALAAAFPEGLRDVPSVRRHASATKVPIIRSPESYSNDGGSHDAGGHVITPAKPYADPAVVFAGVDFRAPTDRPLRGVAGAVRTRGRIGLPPARIAAAAWSGGDVGSGDVG